MPPEKGEEKRDNSLGRREGKATSGIGAGTREKV
jgi:hypothetical protein